MKRSLLEECMLLRRKFSARIREVLTQNGDTESDEQIKEIFDKYSKIIRCEVGAFHFSLIDGIVDYCIDNGLTIDHAINALRAVEIEIE